MYYKKNIIQNLINFVGLLQIKDKNNKLCTFFAFPKEYNYSDDQNIMKRQIKQILKSIFKSNISNNGILQKQDNGYYINRIEIINQLLKYYTDYGIYILETIKSTKQLTLVTSTGEKQ